MDKKQAGSKGGRATFAKHGRNHMHGAKGALVTWTRYTLKPVGLTEYAMVERATGKIKTIRGR